MSKPRVLTINLSCDEVTHCSNTLAGQYRFRFAMATDEAMAAATRFKPDIMVYEIGDPTQHEVQTFTTMKAMLSDRVPVIAVAAENSLEIEQSVRGAGVFYYLVKPYDLQELDVVLRAAFVHSNKERA